MYLPSKSASAPLSVVWPKFRMKLPGCVNFLPEKWPAYVLSSPMPGMGMSDTEEPVLPSSAAWTAAWNATTKFFSSESSEDMP